MSIIDDKKIYDVAFLGSSPLVLMEATFLNLLSKKVLIIEESSSIGGAWSSLNLFGMRNIENAIHYFMPNTDAPKFLVEKLGLSLKSGESKYRYFAILGFFCFKSKYDRLTTKLMANLLEDGSLVYKLRRFLSTINTFKEGKFENQSYYVIGGAPMIIRKIQKLLSFTTINLTLGRAVSEIRINENSEFVELITSNEKFYTKKIYITHGSRIYSLKFNGFIYKINEKQFLRPSLHLYFNDIKSTDIEELIFTRDPIIKYVHNVTNIAKVAGESVNGKKIIIVALQHNIRESKPVIEKIIKKLYKSGIIGKNAKLNETHWQNIYLPRLDDKDLMELKNKFPKFIIG